MPALAGRRRARGTGRGGGGVGGGLRSLGRGAGGRLRGRAAALGALGRPGRSGALLVCALLARALLTGVCLAGVCLAGALTTRRRARLTLSGVDLPRVRTVVTTVTVVARGALRRVGAVRRGGRLRGGLGGRLGRRRLGAARVDARRGAVARQAGADRATRPGLGALPVQDLLGHGYLLGPAGQVGSRCVRPPPVQIPRRLRQLEPAEEAVPLVGAPCPAALALSDAVPGRGVRGVRTGGREQRHGDSGARHPRRYDDGRYLTGAAVSTVPGAHAVASRVAAELSVEDSDAPSQSQADVAEVTRRSHRLTLRHFWRGVNSTGSVRSPRMMRPPRHRNSSGSAARPRSGRRLSSVARAARPSSRASGAPMQ